MSSAASLISRRGLSVFSSIQGIFETVPMNVDCRPTNATARAALHKFIELEARTFDQRKISVRSESQRRVRKVALEVASAARLLVSAPIPSPAASAALPHLLTPSIIFVFFSFFLSERQVCELRPGSMKCAMIRRRDQSASGKMRETLTHLEMLARAQTGA